MRMKRFVSLVIAIALVAGLPWVQGTPALSMATAATAATAVTAVPDRTDFITSSRDYDKILERPYNDDVPLGFSDNLFALHSTGWGFSRVYRTGLNAEYTMPVSVAVDDVAISPDTTRGVYRPSHVTQSWETEITDGQLVDKIISVKTVGEYPKPNASYVSQWGSLVALNDGKTGDKEGQGNTNWTTYETNRLGGVEWAEIEFDSPQSIDGVNLWVLRDGATGNSQPPTAVEILYLPVGQTYDAAGTNYESVADLSGPQPMQAPTNGIQKNSYRFDNVTTQRIRAVFTLQANKCVTISEFEVIKLVPPGQEPEEIDALVSVNTGGAYPAPHASYVSQWGRLTALNDGRTGNNDGGNNWTTYETFRLGGTEWVEIEFDSPQDIFSATMFVLRDGATGNSQPPTAIQFLYLPEGAEYDAGATNYVSVTNLTGPQPMTAPTNGVGSNNYQFDRVTTRRIRAVMTLADNRCATLTEFEVYAKVIKKPDPHVKVTGYKYISQKDMCVSVVKVNNLSDEPVTAVVTASGNNATTASGNNLTGTRDSFNVLLSGQGFARSGTVISKTATIDPGVEETFMVAMALSPTSGDNNAANIAGLFADVDYLGTQKAEFDSWWVANVPYFDSPDPIINQTYYFRWLVYRNNIRKSPVGSYILTEFMPNVSWASTYNAIPCPLGHHYYEGRWIRDTKYLDSYTDYWFNVGEPRRYTSWLGDAIYAKYLVDADRDKIIGWLPNMITNINGWGNPGVQVTTFNTVYGLNYCIADRDGMENAIGGDGIRPTLNSYIYGDSMAIAKVADMANDTVTRDQYLAKAATVKQNMDANLWSDGFYRVRRTGSGATATGNIQDVVEELGLIPWYFNLPDEDKSVAWNKLMDDQYLYAPYGPTTAQRSHASYRAGTQYGTGTCNWNGPSWPFATTQTLVGMANLLNNYNQTYVDNDDYFETLWIYANSHYKENSLDGKKYSWLAEDLNPENGIWIADEARSINYNHSAFNDMIITGLIGLRPGDGDQLTINPLLPHDKWDYFCLENIPYRGKSITIMYDKYGTRYGAGAGVGFSVFEDGVLIYNSDDYEKTVVTLGETETAPFAYVRFYAVEDDNAPQPIEPSEPLEPSEPSESPEPPEGGQPGEFIHKALLAKLSDAADDTVAVSLTFNDNIRGMTDTNMYVAAYDAAGRLLQVEQFADVESGLYPINIPASAASVSVFLWDDRFAPLLDKTVLKD